MKMVSNMTEPGVLISMLILLQTGPMQFPVDIDDVPDSIRAYYNDARDQADAAVHLMETEEEIRKLRERIASLAS